MMSGSGSEKKIVGVGGSTWEGECVRMEWKLKEGMKLRMWTGLKLYLDVREGKG